MTVTTNDHGSSFNLLGIVGFNHIHDIESPEGCKAVLPGNSRTLLLDLFRNRVRQIPELLGIVERIRRKAAQNNVGSHNTLLHVSSRCLKTMLLSKMLSSGG